MDAITIPATLEHPEVLTQRVPAPLYLKLYQKAKNLLIQAAKSHLKICGKTNLQKEEGLKGIWEADLILCVLYWLLTGKTG